MGLIRVRDLPVEVRLGTLPEEHVAPQSIHLDIEVSTDMSRAMALDELEHTVDYIQLVKAIQAALAGTRAHLVETIVSRALDALLALPGVERARVRVRKYHLPGMGEIGHVEVEEEREAR